MSAEHVFLPGPGVYQALAEHQVGEEWEFKKLAAALHRWTRIFDSEFKLQIPQVALSIDYLPVRRLGHFRACNGFGLYGEIALNRRYLKQRPFHELLGTLLHEQLHAWQLAHGKLGKKNNYHNKQFQRRAAETGLLIDDRGHTQLMPDSPFFAVLEKYGVKCSPTAQTPRPTYRIPGKSKLHLYICPCGWRARIGRAGFSATCNHCKGQFQPVQG